MQGAKIILADEPIASLDPESARKVMDMLARMNRDHKLTVVVSLHQVDVAMRYCVRTVALHQGRVVYDGPSSALTPDLLRRLYGVQASELLDETSDASVGVADPAPAEAEAPFLTSMSLSFT